MSNINYTFEHNNTSSDIVTSLGATKAISLFRELHEDAIITNVVIDGVNHDNEAFEFLMGKSSTPPYNKQIELLTNTVIGHTARLRLMMVKLDTKESLSIMADIKIAMGKLEELNK